ncbi:MAG TPA: hypothetical protein VGM23_01555, partial [Armatimonadota bacterium]
WDLRTQMLPDPDKVLSVASDRPLWWKPLVSQRRFDARHRQIIVPLFNPPAEVEVVGSTPVAPADGVRVNFAFAKGETVTATLLSAEPVTHSAPLTVSRQGSGAQVQVPRFWGWTTVVFDCRKQ